MNRSNKLLMAANVAVLGLMLLAGASRLDGDIKVNSITVGDGDNKVVIAANKSMTGLAVHKGHDTVALIGLDASGEASLRLSGDAKIRGLTVKEKDSASSVQIISSPSASGIWVSESGTRFVALTSVKGIGPAIEIQSGKNTLKADDFAVYLEGGTDVPQIQFGGHDGKLHTLDADNLRTVRDEKIKPKSRKPE